MNAMNINKLIESCETLQRRTLPEKGYMHSSVRCFDACMRAFDNSRLPAEAITFRIFFNYPVLREGRATIHRDGTMEMRTANSIFGDDETVYAG